MEPRAATDLRAVEATRAMAPLRSPLLPDDHQERTTPIEPDRVEVTRIPDALGRGEEQAARDLLPLVYDELRRLARQRLAQENPGQTLQPTALVHEAYLRIVGQDAGKPWNGRGHFFSAAAEAMRRILVENARRKSRQKHGGEFDRCELDSDAIAAPVPDDDLLALDEALDKLSRLDPPIAELVKLRYFADLTIPQAAEILGISPRTADFHWKYAKAWLRDELGR
jgi:RNA polymerase sigma factor (TIGR02999 family)